MPQGPNHHHLPFNVITSKGPSHRLPGLANVHESLRSQRIDVSDSHVASWPSRHCPHLDLKGRGSRSKCWWRFIQRWCIFLKGWGDDDDDYDDDDDDGDGDDDDDDDDGDDDDDDDDDDEREQQQ